MGHPLRSARQGVAQSYQSDFCLCVVVSFQAILIIPVGIRQHGRPTCFGCRAPCGVGSFLQGTVVLCAERLRVKAPTAHQDYYGTIPDVVQVVLEIRMRCCGVYRMRRGSPRQGPETRTVNLDRAPLASLAFRFFHSGLKCLM